MGIMHHIKRLEVDLRAPDQEQARDLQQEVSIFCRTQLHEVLEEVFDLAAPDRYLRIDRLELTLPAFRDVADFRNKVTERLRKELGFQLAEAKDVTAAAARAGAGTGDKAEQDTASFSLPYQAADIFLHILKYGIAPWHAMSVKYDDLVNEVIELLQAEHSFRLHLAGVFTASDQVMHRFILQTPAAPRHRILALITGHNESLIVDIELFMENFARTLMTRQSGLGDNYQLLAREITCRNILHTDSINNHVFGLILKELVTELVASSGIKVHRMLSALPLVDMEIETVLPKRWKERWKERWRDAYLSTLASFLPPGDSKAAVYSSADSSTSPESKVSDSVDRQERVQGDKTETEISVQSNKFETKTSIQGDKTKTDIPPKAKLTTEKILSKEDDKLTPEDREGAYSGVDREQPDENTPVKNEERLEIESLHVSREVSGSAGESRDSMETGQNLTTIAPRTDQAAGFPWMSRYEVEEFHLNNAGLVLLAPFFGLVFKDLGYLGRKRDFASEELRTRAVHFSQFLVLAEQHPPEAGLALNKVLCGMEVAEPMERFIDLSTKEQNAAQEVINSALMHWSALKRTSAPVFRQTFLKHEGILTSQGGNWLLRIERTSVDILLDTLPWTISIIKHPWMKQPVMVEW